MLTEKNLPKEELINKLVDTAFANGTLPPRGGSNDNDAVILLSWWNWLIGKK